MSEIVLVVFIIFGLLILVECIARLIYQVKYSVPFTSKVIGEYPYAHFVKKVDSPIYYELIPGFSSKEVNINRYGMRGPEPQKQGTKKRFMLIGESEYFGAKLPHEKDLWCNYLQKLLNANGHDQWEVINASVAGYNTVQIKEIWEKKWHKVKPDILLLRAGANEISQSYAMGSKWKPGLSWPYEFITAMEKKSPWIQKFLRRFCLYSLLRGKNITKRAKFKRTDTNFQWDRTLNSISEDQLAIVKDAESKGIKVGFLSMSPAYKPEMSDQESRSMETLQSNWREFYDGWACYQFEYMDRLKDTLAVKAQIPHLDIAVNIWKEPKRAKYYLDVVHLNAKGHKKVAYEIYNEVEKLGWWKTGENK